MSESIKITDEELLKFNKLKEDIQRNIFEFGELYLEKIELDGLFKTLSDKETQLRLKNSEFSNRESQLIDGVLKKYGDGNLNITTGVFTPTQKSTQ